MSTPLWIVSKCSVCGKESKQITVGSTNAFGSADLDLRPPEMKRSTMPWWIHKCPHCGYVARSLERKSTVTQEWLKSEFFTSCDKREFQSELAALFYQEYLICVEDGEMVRAFHAAQCAAWACDDQGETENAIYCRLCALSLFDKIRADQEATEEECVLRADLLRRTGQFEYLIEEYTGKSFSDELLQSIMIFQIEKARQQDMSCYKIQDVPDATDE